MVKPCPGCWDTNFITASAYNYKINERFNCHFFLAQDDEECRDRNRNGICDEDEDPEITGGGVLPQEDEDDDVAGGGVLPQEDEDDEVK